MSLFLKSLFFLFLFIACLWSCGVVYYCLPGGNLLIYMYLLLLGTIAVMWRKVSVKIVLGVALSGLTVYYLSIQATNGRPWRAPWSKLPEGRIEGDLLEFRGIRDFRYRSAESFDVSYVDETYDLRKLITLDFVVSHWDGLEAVSHTMLSFGFSDGRYLALSAETRLAEGDAQGSLPGLYKRFGFIYIFAKEEDIWALRSNYREEDMYLYRVNIDPVRLRVILTDFVERANRLHTHPEFYNTLTHNCTTGLMPPLKKAISVVHYNPEVLLNGFIDRRAYEKGALQHRKGESFEALKKRSLVPQGISRGDLSLYSRKIREYVGLGS